MAAGSFSRHWTWIAAVLVIGGGWAGVTALSSPRLTLTTAEVKRGDYVDIVEVRGDIRPVRSIDTTPVAMRSRIASM